MKLTSNEVKAILENYRGKTKSDKWIEHCICVGDSAGKIAQALIDIVCTAGGVPNPEDKPFIAKFIKTHKYTISY